MNAKKILEIKGKTWRSGIALQGTALDAGIFSTATNFNPFETLDIMQPSRAVLATSGVNKQIQYFANFTKSGDPYIYGYAGVGSTTALYEIEVLTRTVTDVSAQIATTASARGIIAWSDNVSSTRGLIYATDTTIRANSVPVSSGNDLEILTGLTSAEHKFCEGADGNLYFTNGNKVGKITSTTGTAGNQGDAFVFPMGYTVRDIANDGHYLVIIADNQTGTDQLGTYNCIVGYWDYASEQLVQRYDLKLNSMKAVQIMDGNAYFFANDGLYVCNVSSFPKIVFSFLGNSTLVGAYPKLSSQVIKQRTNIIIWADGNTGNVYGYGSLGRGDNKTMFHDFTITSGSVSALAFSGFTSGVDRFFIGSTTPSLYEQGTNATRNSSHILTCSFALPQPYRFKYIRLVTLDKLASGDTLTIRAYSRGTSELLTDSQTFSYANSGAKRTKIFYPVNQSCQVFNEFNLEITNCNVAIQSIEVWGEPVDNLDQTV